MHLRSILPVVMAIVVATPLAAQDVLIEVVELSTGKPIVGASVLLLDDHGNSVLGNFSDQGGHTVLPAPGSGAYVVQVDKVGYDRWNSVLLHVTGQPIHVRAGVAPTRNPPTMVTRSETSCQQLGAPGNPTGDLWAEIQKALSASAMTEAKGLVPIDVDLYERTLDRSLAIVAERTEQRLHIGRRPALGISWDQVDSARRSAVAGGDVYRAPDAALMVSEQFVKSHCYAAIRGYGPEIGLTGLEFKPARIGFQPELTGVLWLDPKSNLLRSLNFDYVNLPVPLRIARTSGRVEFQQLPGGQWIVPRWYIRMPRVARVASPDAGSATAARDTLIGYQEVGGAARPAGTPAPATGIASGASAAASSVTSGVSPSAAPPATDSATRGASPPASQSVITGIVYDSSTSRPLAGVEVWTGGGRFKTVTGAGGHYALAVDGAISDSIVFEHPRLRLYRVADRVQTISLPAGSHGQANVLVPSYGTIRRTLCGQNETGTEAQGIAAGYVTDASGNPVPRAHVWATWRILWVDQNGKLVSTNQQRTVETDTGSDGSYLMCGFTRGAQITAKVGIAGHSTVEENVVLPSSMVLEHDFHVASR
ncbi:MAG: carboxypeptidase regulatory-like domain-containing protein [Gemmatimonadaceae bacterium]